MNIQRRNSYPRSDIPSKVCSQCKVEKPNADYNSAKHMRDGLLSHCKACQRIKDIKPRNVFSRLRGKIKKEEGVDWTLTFEQWIELIQKPCHYCKHTFSGTASRGLDQIVPKVGYHLGNVVPSCATCNSIKGCHFTADEMIRIGAVIGGIKTERKALGMPMPENATPMSPKGVTRPWGKWSARKFKGEKS